MELNMTRFLTGAMIFASVLVVGGAAQGKDDFLASLGGKWAGRGAVRVEADSPPVNVSCRFNSDTGAGSMALEGRCTGMVVISRQIGAVIKANGSRYSGVYRGSRTGPAALSGRQSGNALDLAIRWAADVNGDRSA